MPLIQSSPNYLQAPQRAQTYNLPAYNQPAAYEPPEQQTGFMGNLGSSLGQGLGEGLQKGLYDYMEQGALEKALGNLKPGGSALDQIKAIASAPPATREFLGKYGLPALQEEQKQQQKMAQQSALASILGGAAGIPQTQGVIGESSSSPQLDREVSGLSDQQLGQLLPMLNPQEQKMVLDVRQRQQKMQMGERSERRKSEEQISTPYILKIQEESRTIPIKKNALSLSRDAIENGDVNTIKQWIVDVTNAEPLRSASAATFKTAGKEYFLSNVARAGTRPNQWIEQQISDMMAKIGRSKEANLNVNDTLKSELNIQEEEIRLANDLSQKYRDELGYVPANISAIVSEQLKPYAQRQLDILGYKFRQNYETDHPNELRRLSKVPQGTPLTLEKLDVLLEKANGDLDKAVKMANQAGYTIMEDDFYNSLGQQ